MARRKSKGKELSNVPLPIEHAPGEGRGHYTAWPNPAVDRSLPRKSPESSEREKEHEPRST